MSAAAKLESSFSREAFARAYRDTITDHIRKHTDGTNVNESTLLTTDYLNHFNEVVMLLELLPSAPKEIASDLASWQHKSYEEHFEKSGFREKSLALAAYRNAPAQIRDRFDATIGALQDATVEVLRGVQQKLQDTDYDGLNTLCSQGVPRLQNLIRLTAGIINGTEHSPDAAASGAPPEGTQAAVDALFDQAPATHSQ